MPARGRRWPRTYKEAEEYLNRIQSYKSHEERLKTQLLQIFEHKEQGTNPLDRIRENISYGHFVSREVLSNPDIYRCLRDDI